MKLINYLLRQISAVKERKDTELVNKQLKI